MNGKQFKQITDIARIIDILLNTQQLIKDGDAPTINATAQFLRDFEKMQPHWREYPNKIKPSIILSDPADIMLWQGLKAKIWDSKLKGRIRNNNE